MPERIPQSTAITIPLKVYLVGSDTPATGKTVGVTISKNGAGFGNPSGGATNATEIAGGWYYVTLSTTDTGTLGPLIVSGQCTGCDNADIAYDVVTASGVNVTQWNGQNVATPNVNGVPIVDLGYTLGTASAGAAGYVGTDQSKITNPTATVDLSNTTIHNLDGNTVQTGDAFARLGAPAGASVSADIAEVESDVDAIVGANYDTLTLQQAIQIIVAMVAGKVSGAGSGTEVFKGADGSTVRVTVTVDNLGNRTATVYS